MITQNVQVLAGSIIQKPVKDSTFVTLYTNRLTLIPFTKEMHGGLYQLYINPSVRRYLLDDIVVEPGWVSTTIDTSQQLFKSDGYGLWAIKASYASPIIGFCGYWRFDQLQPSLQLIYGLLPEYWGKGLATEAARKVVDYGFEKAKFTEIVAAADIPNINSFKVMESLGMSIMKKDEQVIYYKLDRPINR